MEGHFAGLAGQGPQFCAFGLAAEVHRDDATAAAIDAGQGLQRPEWYQQQQEEEEEGLLVDRYDARWVAPGGAVLIG